MQERRFLETLFDATLRIDVEDEGVIIESSPSADKLFCKQMRGARVQDAIPDGKPTCTRFLNDVCGRWKRSVRGTEAEAPGDQEHHGPTGDPDAQSHDDRGDSGNIDGPAMANVPAVVRSLATFSDALGAHFECELRAFSLKQAEQQSSGVFLGLRLCGEKREAADLMSDASSSTKEAEFGGQAVILSEASAAAAAATAPGRISTGSRVLPQRVRDQDDPASPRQAESEISFNYTESAVTRRASTKFAETGVQTEVFSLPAAAAAAALPSPGAASASALAAGRMPVSLPPKLPESARAPGGHDAIIAAHRARFQQSADGEQRSVAEQRADYETLMRQRRAARTNRRSYGATLRRQVLGTSSHGSQSDPESVASY